MKTFDQPFPLRVLCVDDNKDIADSEALLLQLVGLDARACYDGRTALEVADSFKPCVCLLDLDMPGMAGDELASALRQKAEGRPLVLIAVTARGDERSCARIEAASFDLHLVKPVSPHQLIDTLERLWNSVG